MFIYGPSMKGHRESDVLKACLHYLNLNKNLGFYWRNNSTGVYDPSQGIFRKTNGAGMIRGVADILGITKSGKFVAIEVKSPVGKLSPEQRVFLKEISEHGGVSGVVRSLDDLAELMKKAV